MQLNHLLRINIDCFGNLVRRQVINQFIQSQEVDIVSSIKCGCGSEDVVGCGCTPSKDRVVLNVVDPNNKKKAMENEINGLWSRNTL